MSVIRREHEVSKSVFQRLPTIQSTISLVSGVCSYTQVHASIAL